MTRPLMNPGTTALWVNYGTVTVLSYRQVLGAVIYEVRTFGEGLWQVSADDLVPIGHGSDES